MKMEGKNKNSSRTIFILLPLLGACSTLSASWPGFQGLVCTLSYFDEHLFHGRHGNAKAAYPQVSLASCKKNHRGTILGARKQRKKLVLPSSVSNSWENCWLDSVGRMNVSSAPTSVTSFAPSTIFSTTPDKIWASHPGSLTTVMWYPIPYLGCHMTKQRHHMTTIQESSKAHRITIKYQFIPFTTTAQKHIVISFRSYDYDNQ